MHYDYYLSTFDMCIDCQGYAPYDGLKTLCEKCKSKRAAKEEARKKNEQTTIRDN